MLSRRTAASLFLLVFPALSPARADGNNEIFGLWRDPAMQAHVLLYACDTGLCGDLVQLPDNAEPRDLNNPDPEQRSRNLLGLTVIDGFRKADDTGTVWIGGGEQGRLPGRIYVPTNGDTLGDAENTYVIHLTAKDTLTIGIDNCLFSCFAKNTWRRVGRSDRVSQSQSQ